MKLLRVVLLSLVPLLAAGQAWAVFSLDIQPERGGRDIRFQTVRRGQVIGTENVTFTVSTDEGKRYRISQMMHSPLTNAQGEILPPGTIKMFSSSTVRGVLRAKVATPLRAGTDVLYTSDASGTADSFILTFAVDLPDQTPAGLFSSQIIYTLEATDGGVSPVTVVRNIRLEIVSEFRFEVKNDRGGRVLDLGGVKRDAPVVEEILRFVVVSNSSVPYRIYQELGSPLMSEAGASLPAHLITARPILATGEGTVGGEQDLGSSRHLVFTSNARGGSAQFDVVYRSADLSGQVAGRYRSSLSFRVETAAGLATNRAQVIPIALDIEPIFHLDVKFEGGQRVLNFGDFTKGREAGDQRVLIKTQNNLGLPYQITQRSTGPMVNEKGNTIPVSNYTYYVQGPREAAKLVSAKTPVKQGNTVVFVSDGQGKPAELVVNFELMVPPDQPGGRYSSDVSYSMSTL